MCMLSEALKKLKRAERRFAVLREQLRDLETAKRVYLEKIMKGGQPSPEVKKTDQAIKRKILAVSRAKEKVGNLRASMERELAKFRKDLIQEKQEEVSSYVKQRTDYLHRIKELEFEISKYRYLITGKKDHHLVNRKDLLVTEIQNQKSFLPIDEVIGHVKLEISRINRMSGRELLKEYRAREKGHSRKP